MNLHYVRSFYVFSRYVYLNLTLLHLVRHYFYSTVRDFTICFGSQNAQISLHCDQDVFMKDGHESGDASLALIGALPVSKLRGPHADSVTMSRSAKPPDCRKIIVQFYEVT